MNRLTDEDVDYILARFDQTEPKIQRLLVAKLIGDRALLLKVCEVLAMYYDKSGLCDNDDPPEGFDGDEVFNYLMLKKAIAKVKAKGL